MGGPSANQLLYVAEDDEAVRDSLALLLASYGWNVRTCIDGTQCLSAVKESEPAAIVADLRMPSMGAIELHQALIEQGRCIPMVILTVYTHSKDRHRRFPDGIVEFLDKPCDGAMLDAAIRRVISRANRLIGQQSGG